VQDRVDAVLLDDPTDEGLVGDVAGHEHGLRGHGPAEAAERSSSTTTRSPASRSSSTTWLPM
jgi:hypothetical protein